MSVAEKDANLFDESGKIERETSSVGPVEDEQVFEEERELV